MNQQMRISAYNELAQTNDILDFRYDPYIYINEVNSLTYIKFSTDKYKNFKVAVLPLLRALLNASYNVSTNEIFSFNLKPSKINFKNRRKIILPYFSVKYEKVSIEQYGNTIEKHLLHFIEFFEKHTNIEISYVGDKKYKKRYVSYDYWIFLVVLFTYYDGRHFSDRYANKYLPYFDKRSSCSRYSYKLALKELLEWIDVENLKESDNDDVFFIVAQLQKIDETFKFFKINIINAIRKEILSNNSLKKIYNSLDLNYEEVINLADILDKEIFKDDDFIEKCLNLNYFNPIFIFKYFFEHNITYDYVNTCKYDFSKSDDFEKFIRKTTEKKINLKKLISKSKADTLEYIKIVCVPESMYNEPHHVDRVYKPLKDYYFENHKSLIESLEAQLENEGGDNEYLDYLIDKVIDSIPKYEKET